jgi:uncharacterized UBP type Zn finger protein
MNLHNPRYDEDRELDLEEMIDDLFTKRKLQSYCKKCKKDVKGKSQRNLIVLPKSLIIVVDRFNGKSLLNNLVSSFPESLDLN